MDKIDELQIEFIGKCSKYLIEEIQKIGNQLSETLDDITFSNFDYIYIDLNAIQYEDLVTLCFNKNKYDDLSKLEKKFSDRFHSRLEELNIKDMIVKYIDVLRDGLRNTDFIEIYPNEASVKIHQITGKEKQILDINTHRDVCYEYRQKGI